MNSCLRIFYFQGAQWFRDTLFFCELPTERDQNKTQKGSCHPGHAVRVTVPIFEPYQGLCTLLVHTAGVLGGPHTERRQTACEGESRLLQKECSNFCWQPSQNWLPFMNMHMGRGIACVLQTSMQVSTLKVPSMSQKENGPMKIATLYHEPSTTSMCVGARSGRCQHVFCTLCVLIRPCSKTTCMRRLSFETGTEAIWVIVKSWPRFNTYPPKPFPTHLPFMGTKEVMDRAQPHMLPRDSLQFLAKRYL